MREDLAPLREKIEGYVFVCNEDVRLAQNVDLKDWTV